MNQEQRLAYERAIAASDAMRASRVEVFRHALANDCVVTVERYIGPRPEGLPLNAPLSAVLDAPRGHLWAIVWEGPLSESFPESDAYVLSRLAFGQNKMQLWFYAGDWAAAAALLKERWGLEVDLAKHAN